MSSNGGTAAPAHESAADWVREGRKHDLAGRQFEAMECYALAVDMARESAQRRVLAEALRRLGVLHHLRGESRIAEELCERSYQEAADVEAYDLAGEAFNALAGFDVEHGHLEQARYRYRLALDFAAGDVMLVGSVEGNLGVIASVQGAWSEALKHYDRSVEAHAAAGNQRGRAIGYHNMGRLHADQKQWAEAAQRYGECLHWAEQANDCHLTGLALLNQAELHLTLGRYDLARDSAESALRAFDTMDARRDRAGAHRVLGVVFRETNKPALGESHFRAALEIAVSIACPLEEAGAARELARLYQQQGRRDDAVQLLERARAVFEAVGVPHEVADISDRLMELHA
jgi:tetratricopeptide (TPR) repeat protein